MDLTKRGLSEFKSLMKDSKRDWEKNKNRFSEGSPEPLLKDNNNKLKTDTDPEPDPVADTAAVFKNTNNGEKRKRQIDLGHMIFGYFKEEGLPEKKRTEERVGPGRPRKDKSEQVRVIAIKVRPEYVEFLKGLSFGRGMGTRIRIIIDDWNRFKKREKEQVGVIRKAISELDISLKKYAKDYTRAENQNKNEATISELNSACKNIKILINVLKFELGDLKVLLSQEEYRNIEFAYNWAKNYDGGSS
jgi:hypothetical protein